MLLGIYPNELKNYPHKDVHKDVDSSIIFNCQNLGIIRMSLGKQLEFSTKNKRVIRTGIVMDRVKRLPVTPASHMRTVQNLTAQPRIRRPTNMPGKAERWSTLLGLCTLGLCLFYDELLLSKLLTLTVSKLSFNCSAPWDPKESPGSRLWHGTALTIMLIWGVNQWMEDLCLSFPLCVTLPFKKVNLFSKNKDAINSQRDKRI